MDNETYAHYQKCLSKIGNYNFDVKKYPCN